MKISIIIPTLDEEQFISRLLSSLKNQEGEFEILIADGGSHDRTVELAQNYARVIFSQTGRGVQMNTGAKYATGDILLFLHADSQLPPGALNAIRAKMEDDPRMIGGTFLLAFDNDALFLRFYAHFTRFTFRLFHYGDQGIFLRRSTFEELRGYKEIPIMEDVEILQRMRRKGKLGLIKLPIITSARRFLSTGIIKQQLMNIFLVLSYLAGVKPDRLKRWYKQNR